MEQSERKPVFSVIIPTYNREKLIGRAIDSVLNQTFKDFELIIVDDGSTDNTKEIIERYTDQRIRYIYKENGGQNSALNKGIEFAKGKYVAFLDSDDEWLDEKLRKVYIKYHTDTNIDIVYHYVGTRRKNGIVSLRNDCLEGYVYKEVLWQEYLCCPTALVCKKICLDRIGGFDEKFVMYQDDEICYRLTKLYHVGLIKQVLGVMHGDASNRVTTDYVRTARDYLQLINKFKKDIIKNCGKQKIADMYYKAAFHFAKAGNFKMSRKVYNLISRYDVGKKYSRICYCGKVIKYMFLQPIKNAKSQIWECMIGRKSKI